MENFIVKATSLLPYNIQAMQKTKFFVIITIILITLFAIGLLTLFSSVPIFKTAPMIGPKISWPGLPVPVITNADWTSFAVSTQANDALAHDGLIWAGTNGGVIVWSEATAVFATFAVEHGLAGNVVTAVSVGRDGAIWLGTASGGVSRYDGSTWQSFTSEDGLPANHIQDIITSQDGTVWLATDAGVAQFNGRRWTYTDQSRSLLQLPSDNVRVLALGKQPGTGWAGTDKGVAYFNGRLWQNYSQAGTASINDIRDLAVGNDGTVWAATAGGLKQLVDGEWEIYALADGLLADSLQTVTAVSDTNIWVTYSEATQGITQLDFSSGLPIPTQISLPSAGTFSQINNITLITNGQLVSTDEGVWQRTNSGEWQQLPHPPTIPLDSIAGMATVDGTVWIGGEGSVGRWQNNQWQFFDDAAGLPATNVHSLTTDSNGNLWAAFNNIRDGVATFDTASQQWIPFGCGINGPPSARVRTAVSDTSGHLWFATTRGLVQFDGQSWHIFDEEDGLPSASIQTLARDPAGNIWVGTNKGLAMRSNDGWLLQNQHDIRELSVGADGLVWMITDDAILRRDGDGETAVPPPPSEQIFDLLAIDNGFLLATVDGIFQFQDKQYSTHFTAKDGLGSNRVTALVQAKDGTIWAGNGHEPIEQSDPHYGTFRQQSTYLSRLTGDKWQSYLITPSSGVSHPIVTDIAQSTSNDIWFATLNGVSRTQGGNWQTYGQVDGLPAQSIYHMATTPNAIWAVTEDGLAQFDETHNQWLGVTQLQNVWDIPRNLQMTVDENGRLWVGNEDKIALYDGNRWTMTPVPFPQPDAKIRALTTDSNSRLWVAAATSGQTQIGIFDGQDWTWVPFNNDIRLMAFAPDGRLWVGTDAGIYIADLSNPEMGQLSLATQDIRDPQFITFLADGTPLVSGRYQQAIHRLDRQGIVESIAIPLPEMTHVYTALAAADGSIWVGTDQGAARYIPTIGWDLFHTPTTIADQSITALTEAPDGSIWVGTFNGNILQTADGIVVSEFPDGFTPQINPVGALLFDAQNQLWKGVFGGAISRLNVNSQNGRSWEHFAANTDITDTEVNSLAIDTDGLAWLGTDKGLFTISTDGETAVCQFEAAGTELFGHSMVADPQSGIWVVQEKILWQGNRSGFERERALILPITAVAPDGSVWTANKNELIRIVGDSQQKISTSGVTGDLTTIAFDENGRIWLGTTEGAWLNENGRWTHFTTQDGLANNYVTHIQITNDGTVWFATKGGLSRSTHP